MSNRMKIWVRRRCHLNSRITITTFIRNNNSNNIRNCSGRIREIMIHGTTVRCVKCVTPVKCVTIITRGTTRIIIRHTTTIIISNSDTNSITIHSNNIISAIGTTSMTCQFCQLLDSPVGVGHFSGIIRGNRIIRSRPCPAT